MRRTVVSVGPASFQNLFFLDNIGLHVAPLAPRQAFGRAEREQSKRFCACSARGGSSRQCGRCVYHGIRGIQRETNSVSPPPLSAIHFCENGIDREECCGG